MVKRRVDKLERKLDNVDESVDALQDSHRQEMIALLNNRVDRLGQKLDDLHDSVNALQDTNDTKTAVGEEARPSVNTVAGHDSMAFHFWVQIESKGKILLYPRIPKPLKL